MKAILSLVIVFVFSLVSLAGDPLKSKADFDKFGPKLYKMDEALKVSKETGKPVVCWMGKNLFDNADARKLSLSLGETTIQAAMDTDGTEFDKLGFRVKFSSNNYDGNAEVYNIRLKHFNEPGVGEEILRVSRGGKPTFKVK